jgi:hypothetical protein
MTRVLRRQEKLKLLNDIHALNGRSTKNKVGAYQQIVSHRAPATQSVSTIAIERQIKTILTSFGVLDPPRFQAYPRFIHNNMPRQVSKNLSVPLNRRKD